jgi:hypothetical protein
MERHKQQQRQQQLARAQQHASRPAALLHKLWARGTNMATDHLRSVLILAVFGFKVGLTENRGKSHVLGRRWASVGREVFSSSWGHFQLAPGFAGAELHKQRPVQRPDGCLL